MTSDNLLPGDGIANYHGVIFSPADKQRFYDLLIEKIPWKNDEAVMFGRHIVTSRKVAWMGDADYAYTYSKTTKQAIPWTSELLEIKQLVEKLAGVTFNSCLLNLYHHGGEGMGWHSDDERSLEKHSPIASVSFGAARKFSFRHRQTRETVSLFLEDGSLLVMKGATQTNWQHQLPKSLRIATPRINLTFRRMIG